LWQWGNNEVHGVYSLNNTVVDSFYENNCPNTIVQHTKEDSNLLSFEATEIANGTYVEKTPISMTFDWDTCADLTLPTTKCEEFPRQRLGITTERVNVNTGEEFCEVLYG